MASPGPEGTVTSAAMANTPSSGRPGRAQQLTRAVANLAAWQIAGIFVALGVGLVYLSGVLAGSKSPNALETTIREIGALLFVTGALTVFWDLRGRRALTNEVLAAANLSSDVTAAGLRRVAARYLTVDWDDFLGSAAHADLFFAYARTWRMAHATGLRRFAAREGTRLRVILPDMTDEGLMAQLAAKFRYTPAELASMVQEAESDFDNLARQASSRSNVDLRRTKEFPVFTYYRFDRTCFGVLYAQAPGRTDVPTLECVQGGTLYAFFRDQFEALWADSVRPNEENAST